MVNSFFSAFKCMVLYSFWDQFCGHKLFKVILNPTGTWVCLLWSQTNPTYLIKVHSILIQFQEKRCFSFFSSGFQVETPSQPIFRQSHYVNRCKHYSYYILKHQQGQISCHETTMGLTDFRSCIHYENKSTKFL